MKEHYIYKTTCTINNKFYYGSHFGETNDTYLGSGKDLKKDIEKYGRDKFINECIEICEDEDELCEKEREYILNNIKNPLCYNKNIVSAKNHHCVEETRKKMSENHADFNGENHPMFGKSHSAESRKKMSKSHNGKSHSNETKVKISKANSNPSEETRKKMSNAQIGENNPCFGRNGIKNPAYNTVYCYDKSDLYTKLAVTSVEYKNNNNLIIVRTRNKLLK